MAPGRQELKEARPFVGKSGAVFWSWMKQAGMDRSDCYIVNCIGEYPENAKGKEISAGQWDRWWDQFDRAIEEYRGRTVVALGGDAFWRLTGLRGGITDWRGYLVSPSERSTFERRVEFKETYKAKSKGHKAGDVKIVRRKVAVEPPQLREDATIFPTLHPAAVLRSGFLEAPLLCADLRRVRRVRTGTSKFSRTSFEELCRNLPGPVAVDIETDGIESGISRVGIANKDSCWSDHWNYRTQQITSEILGNPDGTTIIHNASFDYPRLAGAGAAVRGRVFDTMLAAALLQPDFKKGLNTVASFYLDCQKWKPLRKRDGTVLPTSCRIDAMSEAEYNALDTIREYEIWEQETELLAETGQTRLFQETIMKTLPYLFEMSSVGMAVHQERCATWVSQLEDQLIRDMASWQQVAGLTEVNSPKQVKSFFGRLGIELPYNGKGKESTDKESIARLCAEYPEHVGMFALFQRLKKAGKDLATYAKVGNSPDGRVHAEFVPNGKDEDEEGKGIAGSWRITCRNPPLQQQPQVARCIYIPSRGMVFVGGDYSQLEARILGGLSGDQKLTAACDFGIHAYNANRLKVDKTRAKNGFYGWSYLAGPKTLYNTFISYGYKVPMADCENLLAGFDSEYAVAAAFRQRALVLARSRRFVENPFGLRRYYPHETFPAPSAASTLIQSSGAMMMWIIIPQLAEALKSLGGRLLLTVHDDVLGEVPRENKDKALRALKEIMEQPFDQIAPGWKCPAQAKWSDQSWGEMEEVDVEELAA